MKNECNAYAAPIFYIGCQDFLRWENWLNVIIEDVSA